MSLDRSAGVYLEDKLPYSWSVVATEQAEDDRDHRDLQNLERLKVLNGLDDSAPAIEFDDYPTIGHEFQRIDNKLNILLQMVGQMLHQGQQFPEVSRVFLFSDKVIWDIPVKRDAPQVGQVIENQIYLSTMFPTPIILRCKVDSITVLDDGTRSVRTQIIHTSDEFYEVFEKYIFRAHRRQIARARRKGMV